MRIDEPLNFGKYVGLTIRQVYQGCHNLNIKFIETYFELSMKSDYNSGGAIFGSHIMIWDDFRFEISDTLIRASPLSPDFEGNNSELIAKIFKSKKIYDYDLTYNVSFGDFIYYIHKKNRSFAPSICNGVPEYISFCINNVNFFSINKTELLELQNLPVFTFEGAEVIHKIEDIYTYRLLFSSSSYKFDDNIIKLSDERFENKNEGQVKESDDLENNNDSARDNFDAWSDGEMGSYDDFDGD